jgi:hypothetical protein
MGRDQDEALIDLKEDLLRGELDKFMESCTGDKPKGDNWMQTMLG